MHFSIPLLVLDPLRAFKFLKLDNPPPLQTLRSPFPSLAKPLSRVSLPSLASLALLPPSPTDPPSSTSTDEPSS
jgi:hypothetical protein